MFSIKIIWLLFIVVIQASKCYTFEQYQQQQQPFYERIPSYQFRNQYQYPDVNYNHNNNGELNTNCANNFKNPPYAGSNGNNNAYNAFNRYPMFPYKTDLQSHKFNGYKSNTYNNDMPRKSKFEEDYITYDTKNKGNNGRGNDNNKYEQQYDEKSHKDLSKEYYKDEKDLSNKKADDEVKPNDLGSFVKGTYDENYYKTEKRQKRNTPKHDELINAHLLDFNDNNTPNVDFNRQKLSNINSNPKSNGTK